MGVISVKHGGNFNNLERFLKSSSRRQNLMTILKSYALEGVAALTSATPIDSGKTANSWGYNINLNKNSISLNFTNSNINQGVPIAILIQYGHGTRHGGYVRGRDYINPAIQPIFDNITNAIWREVTQ